MVFVNCLVVRATRRCIWVSETKFIPAFDPAVFMHRVYAPDDIFFRVRSLEATVKADEVSYIHVPVGTELQSTELLIHKAKTVELFQTYLDLYKNRFARVSDDCYQSMSMSPELWIRGGFDKKMLEFKLTEYRGLVYNIESNRLSFFEDLVTANTISSVDKVLEKYEHKMYL